MSRRSSSDEDVGIEDQIASMDFELAILADTCRAIRDDVDRIMLSRIASALDSVMECSRKLAAQLATMKRSTKRFKAQRRFSHDGGRDTVPRAPKR